MSRNDLTERSVEEFKKVLADQASKWIKDKNGVYKFQEVDQRLVEHISFPSNIYKNEHAYLDSFWVYCRAKLIIQALRKRGVNSIWEFGAGDGRVSIPVVQSGISVIASEPHYEGAQTLAKHNIFVCNASLAELSLKNETVGTIGIFDVLEHIQDSASFLQEINRVLKPGSLLFLTVPAHQWLFSNHDIALGHYRRYSNRSLRRELNLAGFKELEVRYFFASLIVPAFFMRRIPYLLGRKKLAVGDINMKVATEGGMEPHPTINKVLRIVLTVDGKFKFPFGLSLLGVFEKL